MKRQLNWKVRMGVAFATFHILLYVITLFFASRRLPLHPQLLYLMAFLDNPVITLFDFLQVRLGWLSHEYRLSDFLFVFGTIFYFLLGLLTAQIYQRISSPETPLPPDVPPPSSDPAKPDALE